MWKNGHPLAAAMLTFAFAWMAYASDARAQIPVEELPQRLQVAIEQGINYLKRQQKANGSWSDPAGQPGGMTGLCTLALLNAGVSADDPTVRQALSYLRKMSAEDIDATYSVALQTMVFCRAEPDRDRAQILENVRWFEKTQVKTPPGEGGWSYPGIAPDNSNSQFALLALHEAERIGVSASDETWNAARQYWENCQNADGSWGYRRSVPGTGSMTCAGIAALIITSQMVHQADARVDGENIDCCRRATADNDRIRRGLDWLARHFSVSANPQEDAWLYYYLYGLERVGRLSSQRFIGGHDWYREGAAHLLELKSGRAGGASGGLAEAWVGPSRTIESEPLIATSFALLFLAKGRRPVLLGKMKFGDEGDWNRHRSDAANITDYTQRRWEMDLTWQTVDLADAGVSDLRQSPVLYFAGFASPLPSSPEAQQETAQKLRDYVDRGGFILAEPACPGGGFDQGFRRLIELAFPEPEYRLKLLPPEHPVWRAEEPVPPAYLRPLLGIEFGCRTSVIYVPPDENGRPSLSCLWELARTGRDTSYPEGVQKRIDAAKSLGVNILAYATNRQLEYKYAFFRPSTERNAGETTRRNALAVASLRHPGGCTVAPRAIVNLLEAAQRELGLRVEPVEEDLDITDPRLFDYHIAFMHGRNGFRLTDEERQRLRTFAERGGTVLADAVCANRAFAESFAHEMSAIFPERPLEPIPPDDPLLTTRYGGFDLRQVTRRDPQPAGPNEPLAVARRQVPPELLGVRIDDRWAVIFSPYDLSCALEKFDSVECRGYTPEDAARIGVNCILYALQQ